MSWLFHGRGEEKQLQASEVLYGVSFAAKKIGEDLVIEGRARTLNDVIRLKRLVEEILSEMIRRHEDKRTSSTTSRYR